MMRAHYVNTTENQKFLFNVLSLMHSPIMYWQSKDAQQLFFIVLPPCDGNTNSILTQKEILLDFDRFVKKSILAIFCPPNGLSEMAYHWIQKRCPGEKRAKVATDKAPKSTLGGITPNLRDETCRALNYVWKIGITKEQQGKQHGT